MRTDKPRLLIISNRLPIQLTERGGKINMRESDGGLVSALKSYFDNTSNNSDTGEFSEIIWIGAADFPEQRWIRYKNKNTSSTSFSIEPLFIGQKEYNLYYNGFCNAILWPLFHYFPSFVEYSEDAFNGYENVNAFFADKLLDITMPGDILWIQDYQLMLLPELIRKKRSDVLIGFFLHIPFPSYELFRLLHKQWKEKIIHGLLGADLIGFHTHDYVQHFLDNVQRITGVSHHFRKIQWNGRKIQTSVFPLGIDFEKFHNMPDTQEVNVEKEAIRSKFGDSKIIFSVDRLDYTKGITHRLSGFERFLELHPVWREKIVFILVVVPSRQIVSKYNERRKLIEEQVSRINGKYSTLQWQPILYRYNTLKFWELNVMYQIAHIGLITPLRDGMNLVAKEFVASRKNQDGVLILSELAGAAHEMSEALMVNPTDKNEVAHAISEALNMDKEEQHSRMLLLQERLKIFNVAQWISSFIDTLKNAHEDQSLRDTQWVSTEITDMLRRNFIKSTKRLIFIDYDGTLVPFKNDPKSTTPNEELLNWLSVATKDLKNQIVIISGRNIKLLEKWFHGIPVHLIAEHGAQVKLIGHERIDEDISFFPEAKLLRPTLDIFTARCPGSFVEEKDNSLAWHYRAVEKANGFKHSRELMDCLFHFLRNSTLNLMDGNKVIEIRPSAINKGIAASKVKRMLNPDFTLAIGDDVTDEDMFVALSDGSITVKVGTGLTKAIYRLPEQNSVLPFLQNLTAQNI